ncbi:MAG: ATP-binding protein [Candidatus Beckwithbacteria bacterium]|nr:ATP-binding protein [Patescibacteria group bacterium]
MIQRKIFKKVLSRMDPGKVVVIYGPRRVGKTTLLNQLSKELNSDYLMVNGQERRVKRWLGSQDSLIMRNYLKDKKILLVDEAQYVDQIGLNLKILVDMMPEIKVVATGSSSFELANQVGEPLVGRKWQFILYPLAQLELSLTEDQMQVESNLESRLIFGSYPEVVLTDSYERKKDILDSIVDGYILKDLLVLENLKKEYKLIPLLKLLAFQIGKEVSLSELSNNLNMSFHTVERYLYLLEKVFVIMRVGGFSRNLRKEVNKNSRYYFYDNGIRNAVIENFNDLSLRNDVGQLWENYLFMERLKKRAYIGPRAYCYFWRTYDKKEIDLIEEREGKLFGYEFKWSERKKTKPPKDWLKTYDNASYKVINRENYSEFIT